MVCDWLEIMRFHHLQLFVPAHCMGQDSLLLYCFQGLGLACLVTETGPVHL